jgi:hypothetical protein
MIPGQQRVTAAAQTAAIPQLLLYTQLLCSQGHCLI